MYYAMRASAPYLHRESTDSLIKSLRITSLQSGRRNFSGYFTIDFLLIFRVFWRLLFLDW